MSQFNQRENRTFNICEQVDYITACLIFHRGMHFLLSGLCFGVNSSYKCQAGGVSLSWCWVKGQKCTAPSLYRKCVILEKPLTLPVSKRRRVRGKLYKLHVSVQLLMRPRTRGKEKTNKQTNTKKYLNLKTSYSPSGLLLIHSISSLYSPFLSVLVFPIYPISVSILIPSLRSCPSASSPLLANSIAPFVSLPLCPLSSFPLHQTVLFLHLPLLSLLIHSFYCHTLYLSHTVLQRRLVLGIGTCTAAHFHSGCLISE